MGTGTFNNTFSTDTSDLVVGMGTYNNTFSTDTPDLVVGMGTYNNTLSTDTPDPIVTSRYGNISLGFWKLYAGVSFF